MFWNDLVSSWICWGILVFQKINNIGLRSHGHIQKIKKSWKWRVFEFSHNEIEKLLAQRWNRKTLQSFPAILRKYSQWKWPPRHPRPQIRNLRHIVRIFYGNQLFFKVMIPGSRLMANKGARLGGYVRSSTHEAKWFPCPFCRCGRSPYGAPRGLYKGKN